MRENKRWGFFGGDRKGVSHAVRREKKREQVGGSQQKYRQSERNPCQQGKGRIAEKAP